MTMTKDQMIEQNDERLANHKLEVICDTERVKCFRLNEGRTVIYSTYFTFTPDGISIAGDTTPSCNADYCRGYNLNWFVGRMDDSYLAEKFRLRKRWIQEKAYKEWKGLTADLEDPDGIEIAESLIFDTPNEHYEALTEMGWEDDPTMEWLADHEVAWLVSLQRAFRREYLALTAGRTTVS